MPTKNSEVCIDEMAVESSDLPPSALVDWTILPDDILINIFYFLPADNLLKVSQVSDTSDSVY